MKKGIVLCIMAVVASVLMPINAKALKATVYAAKDTALTQTTLAGNSFELENSGDNTTFYLGVDVTEGTLTEYNVHIKLENSNFRFKSGQQLKQWKGGSGAFTANDDGTEIDVRLTNAGIKATSTKELVARINLEVSDSILSTETCKITITAIEDEEKPEPTPTTPKCTVSNNKYYDANGNEVSKEQYEKSCNVKENPQTGSFLPFTIVIAGIAVAGGLYFVAKKNNKIYHV